MLRNAPIQLFTDKNSRIVDQNNKFLLQSRNEFKMQENIPNRMWVGVENEMHFIQPGEPIENVELVGKIL